MKVIDRFEDTEYFFLSNFYPAPVKYKGIQYKTSEHAFQAAKAANKEDHDLIARQWHPGMAKKWGQVVPLRHDWNSIKYQIMLEIVFCKFAQNPELKVKLLDTRHAELIEGNTWGDTIWGVVDGVGHNWLGRILMVVRDILLNDEPLKSFTEIFGGKEC